MNDVGQWDGAMLEENRQRALRLPDARSVRVGGAREVCPSIRPSALELYVDLRGREAKVRRLGAGGLSDREAALTAADSRATNRRRHEVSEHSFREADE